MIVFLRNSYELDPERIHHRLAWCRLIYCAVSLLNWALKSALPPTSLLTSIQNALLDPGIDIFFPALNKQIFSVLMVSFIIKRSQSDEK